MWKIARLYLKNFIPVYSGMNKREVELDFTNIDKKINIFIGKMGSGKSSILGHLQPFATYGSLDIRNQEDMILTGEDGLKEITFIHNSHVYEITHKYSWSSTTQKHTTKSYIKLDGTELNENGNVNSFKEIVHAEFGIDQNFLRLLRLGPNVSNLINMKAIDRKAFIATLLKETEIYTMLYQKLSEEYRSMNGAVQMLSNKLVNFKESEDSLEDQSISLSEDLTYLQDKLDKIKKDIAKLEGLNIALSNNQSSSKMDESIESNKELLDSLLEELASLEESIKELKSSDPQKVSIEFGEVSNRLTSLEEHILKTEALYKDKQNEIISLKDQILIKGNDDHLDELKSRLGSLEKQYQQSQEDLRDFHPSLSYSFLVDFMNITLETFQAALEEMANNSPEVISKCFYSDKSIIPWATKKLGILNATLLGKKKLLSNINFSVEYECPIPLYIPPMCPTTDCPFIKTHPVIIAENSKDKRSKIIVNLQNEIASLEKDINTCEEYISQYPKMQNLKKMWESVSSILTVTGALEESSLYKILSNLRARTNWYDHSILMRYVEKSKQYEDFSQLEIQVLRVQNELSSLQGTEVSVMKDKLETLKKESQDLLDNMTSSQKERADLSSRKESLEKLLLSLKDKESLELTEARLKDRIDSLKKEISDLESRRKKVMENEERVKSLQLSYTDLETQYKIKSSRYTEIQLTLQDIKSTKASYDEYIEERNNLKLLIGATSSKEGIPLVMVKLFLEECKEIINDLISDIFEDDLEILEFDISAESNEFKIPYRINGNYVNDIEMASQGQQAVISIAISFALCQKSMFDYNIMLLDEIDNSIHKSDRERFIMILAKQMQAVGSEQIFLITHNDIFQQSGLPVNIIMTTKEVVDIYPNQTTMEL